MHGTRSLLVQELFFTSKQFDTLLTTFYTADTHILEMMLPSFNALIRQ
jgi:hypothetical protein